MKSYIISKATTKIDEKIWETTQSMDVNVSPWEKFKSPYTTKAQLVYDDEAIYVHFSTDETDLRAEQIERNTEVSEDSCVEFFFSPDKDDERYINFEINPIGTVLMFVCAGRGKYENVTEDLEVFDIKIVITKSGWEVFYKIPFYVIRKYFGKITKEMRGNFYKCGAKTKIEHYACWNEIKTPMPDYHRPEFFGNLYLDGME